MEEYVEIPTELDTQDIEIRTCDEVTAAGMAGTDAAQHFYIVQQTSEGIVIQIAEPNDADVGKNAPGLSKQVGDTTVVHLNQSEVSELVTPRLMNAGDIAALVTSEVTTEAPVTCDETGNVVMSELIAADDIISVAASEMITGDVEASELVDSNVGDIQENGQGGGHCEVTGDVHDTDFDGGDSVDHACSSGDAAADHAYSSDGHPSDAVLVDNISTDIAQDVAENVQDHVLDVTPDVQVQVSNGTLGVQHHVSNGTSVQQQVSDDLESEVGSNSEEAVTKAVVGPSDLSSKVDAVKAAPSRRTSTRARKCRVTNETSNASAGMALEPSNEELQPKVEAYQRWQCMPLNKDTEKACAVDTDEASAPSNDALEEKNEASKQAGKRKSFTTLVANNRRVCYARKENNGTSESSLDLHKPNVAVVAKTGMDVSKSGVLAEMADIHSLKVEMHQLQKLNAELKSQMKQMEHKSLLHHADRKVLTGSSDRVLLSSGGDRKIGINWKDMKFSVRKLASPRNTSPKDSVENKAYLKKIDSLASQGRELLHREEMAEKKEQRLKALDMELDRRSSMIKCKEAKLERLESQLKARENTLILREKRLSNRESREEDTSERVDSHPTKEGKFNEREKQLRVKEKELGMKQELLRATERQLTALGQELTDKFHYLKTKQGSRNVSVAMATSIVASQKSRGASKFAASAGSDSNNNRNTGTAPAVKKAVQLRAARKVAPLGVSRKMTQLPAARKVTRIAVVVAKQKNHLKAVGNVLATNKKNANKRQPSKGSSLKPPGKAQKVVLKRKRSADKSVCRQSKRRKM